MRNQEASIAFDGVHDIERWDVRVRHSGVEVGHFRFHPTEPAEEDSEAAGPELPPIGERLVMLALQRAGQSMRPLSRGYTPAEGDRIVVAIHVPDLDDALAALDARGFVRDEETTSEE